MNPSERPEPIMLFKRIKRIAEGSITFSSNFIDGARYQSHCPYDKWTEHGCRSRSEATLKLMEHVLSNHEEEIASLLAEEEESG